METSFDTADLPIEALPGLQPRDYTILGKLFEGKKPAQIAREMGMTSVSHILNSPSFKSALQRMEAAYASRIARGEFGALAIAKQEQERAMMRLVKLSRRAEDERVRLNATLELLKLGGIQPPKQQVTENVERLIDQMTGEEADRFAKEGIFPERFRDQMARLATNVIKSSEAKRYEAKVEVIEVGSDGEILNG